MSMSEYDAGLRSDPMAAPACLRCPWAWLLVFPGRRIVIDALVLTILAGICCFFRLSEGTLLGEAHVGAWIALAVGMAVDLDGGCARHQQVAQELVHVLARPAAEGRLAGVEVDVPPGTGSSPSSPTGLT